MNLIKKQGFYNSIILYAGTALGFFNLIILFQRFLTAQQIGFFNLIIAVSLLFVQIASLGFGSVIVRFFPYFKTDDKKNNGFPFYVFKVTLISFVLVALLYVGGREFFFIEKIGNNSSLFYQYYYWIIPVALFTLWYNLAETFARASFNNIIPSFLREIILKLLTSIAIMLIFYQVIVYQQFVYWYVGANALILLGLLVYLKKQNLLRFGAVEARVKLQSTEMLKYGFFAMLAGGSFAMIQNIDTLLLKVFSGEAAVGYYGTFFGMAMVISLPAKALSTTSYPIIANAWQSNDLEKINKIYKKTSLVQFLIGCLLLIGLIANWQNILFLLYKPEYANFYSVFIVLSLGFLCDITGGLNGAIISFSKHYKLVMYILVGAVVLCALLNIILIPKLGMLGAAIAYTLTMFTLNFTYWLYLLLKYKLQPFNYQFLKLICIALIALAFGLLVPYLFNFYIDVAARSIMVATLYLGFIYVFKISPDINQFMQQIVNKVKFKF
jgi:O-antigen/teichoic acid export membrane protein